MGLKKNKNAFLIENRKKSTGIEAKNKGNKKFLIFPSTTSGKKRFRFFFGGVRPVDWLTCLEDS